jgi:hypothetical protein
MKWLLSERGQHYLLAATVVLFLLMGAGLVYIVFADIAGLPVACGR